MAKRSRKNKYKISKGVLFNILKHKQEYLEDYKSNQSSEVKGKIKNDRGRQIDYEIYSWSVV